MPENQFPEANETMARALYLQLADVHLERLLALTAEQLKQSIQLALLARKKGPSVFPGSK